MNKTNIEWCDYTINPVRGLCPVACSYCYARRMYKRFKWDTEIRMEPDWQEDIPKKPSRIFVGSTMELFGDWVEDWMWDSIWQYVNSYLHHTFIFLTKRPENLINYSPFPKNVWVGVSAVHRLAFWNGCHYLSEIEASVKFFSFEPLQESMQGHSYANMIADHLNNAGINWLIIGQQTPVNKLTMVNLEWVTEIVEAADELGIPVFLKNNLNSCAVSDYPELLDKHGNLRQEFPREQEGKE